MRLKEFDIFRNIWLALKDFFKEDGLDKSSVLAYYSIFSSLFLLTFFTFLFTRFLGDPDITLKSIYPFSPDFFSKVSPEIFKKAGEISTKMKEVGVVGIILSLILGFLVIKKIVQFVNSMFYIDLREKRSEKDFLVRRISEFSLLFIMGLLVIITFFITGLIPILTSLFLKNKFIAPHINPSFVDSLNNFLVLYVVPFLVTFLFFFILYKWIPEKIVYVKGAFIAAIICAVLWELVKRAYAYYMVNISIFGQIKGPIIAIILFGFWMELSMGIMLYGAKLTYIFDKRKNDKFEKDQSTG
jgi:YihY family inner membrane protein